MQPIRPQDATSIYQKQSIQGADPASAAPRKVTAAGSDAGGRRTDKVTVSAQARELYRAMQAVDAHSDVRADRVEALRAQIDAGTYKVDAQGLAQRLVEDGFTA